MLERADSPSSSVPRRATDRPLAVWAAALVALGWGLMTLGAFVRASESGLGCPDWPLCDGRLIAGANSALTEEAHRWVVTALSVGILGLALGVRRNHRHERSVTRPTLGVLALLVLQVVLGAITVLLRNVSWTVVIHYGGAALLVVSLALLAVRLAVREPAATPPRDRFATSVSWLAALSFGLLLAGSTVANTDSHTACGRGWPLCNGSLLPALDHYVAINLTHRVWAAAMLLLALWIAWRSRRERPHALAIRLAALAVGGLYVLEASIGIVVLAVGENTAVDVIHSSVASLTWTALAILLALTRTLPAAPATQMRSLA